MICVKKWFCKIYSTNKQLNVSDPPIANINYFSSAADMLYITEVPSNL